METDPSISTAERSALPSAQALDRQPPAAGVDDQPATTAPTLQFDADMCHAVADDLQNDGRGEEAEAFYRAALAQASERPDTWCNLGLAVLRAGRLEEAVACEREALRLDPESVEAMNNLGIAMHGLNALPEAENHFHGALRLAPDHANATLNLGVIRQSLGHLREAETLYRRARALGASAGRVGNNLALALAEMDRMAEAEATCRDALTANPGYPEAAVNLAMILLMRGKMKEAWPHYEARWNVAPMCDLARLPAEARWTGSEPIEGKTILLLAEQGFGDALQFCRYVPMVAKRGARVILAVPSPLARLMRTLDGADRVVSSDEVLPAFDFHCPLLSLPLAFDTTEETIPWRVPYLEADAEAIERWTALLSAESEPRRTRIGLVWAGAHRTGQPGAAAIDKRRSMRLADMAPLGAVADRTFVSLQLGPAARQGLTSPFPLIDLTDRLTDFAETAALIEALDLVITVDTAVAHLTGALGKPVWLLNRFDACWRWPRDRDDSAWYPTMRLFRQTRPGDWTDVIRRVVDALPGFQTFG
jgi:Flp pilus assembly protein TadD